MLGRELATADMCGYMADKCIFRGTFHFTNSSSLFGEGVDIGICFPGCSPGARDPLFNGDQYLVLSCALTCSLEYESGFYLN